MQTPTFTKYTLIVAGIVALAVGFMLLLAPTSYYGASGARIADFADLLSDLRGTGGSFVALGSLVIAGAFRRSLTRPAVIIASLVYLSYAATRVFALLVDGTPSATTLIAWCVELGIGTACALAAGQQHRAESAVAT